MEHFNTNICALSTPQGVGAIAIIRMSGKDTIDVIDKIFIPAGGKQAQPYLMRFGSIKDGERLIDECLVATFNAPHSYTGENSAEIYCHGSSYIVKEIMALLFSYGIKLAEPGEFSKRAFLNGKLDLAQAEAVMDLISSETEAAHRVAMQQMKGGFSNELREMRNSLLDLVSMMELELDFSEEDVEFADRTQLNALLGKVSGKVLALIESFKLGNVIKNGVPVAIIGATNTGKSTLLNTLVGEERAIVSNIHGTTRDVIEDTVNLGGITFRFIDTAGIRETKETIEIIGIERTYKKLQQASVIIMVLDATRPEYFESSLKNLSTRINGTNQQLIILINKADRLLQTGGNTLQTGEEKQNAGNGNNENQMHVVSTDAPAFSDLKDVDGVLCDNKLNCTDNIQNINGLQEDDAKSGTGSSSDALQDAEEDLCSKDLRNIGNVPDENKMQDDANEKLPYSIPDSIPDSINAQIERIKQICNLPSSLSMSDRKANMAESNNADTCDKGKAPLLSPIAILPVSAKHNIGIDSLKQLLTENRTANIEASQSSGTLVTNMRHYQALVDAQIALERVENGLKEQIPTDLVAQDIREALYHLGSIIGEINTEEVLGNIFSRFCIGK